MSLYPEYPATRPRRGLRSLAVPLALAAALTASVLTPVAHAGQRDDDLAAQVNPFIGTKQAAGGIEPGHTFPGAVVPFGMVQLSPDTVRAAGGGYRYEDNRLRGFSLTHLSGPGCTGGQDLPVMPISGTVKRSPATYGQDYVRTFSHDKEEASPGYYAVTDDSGVRTELTASPRNGVARFNFPAGAPGTVLLNVTGAVRGVTEAEAKISGDDNKTVSGWAKSGGFCGSSSQYYVYFSATFDQPVEAAGTWLNDSVKPDTRVARGASPARVGEQRRSAKPGAKLAPAGVRDVIVRGPGSGVYLQFANDEAKPVTMKTAVSFVSVGGAQRNARAEVETKDFDQVKAEARAEWNRRLGQIQTTGGAPEQRRMFYTALYHAQIHPSVFNDVDGQYMGFDSRSHHVRKGHQFYANFSGWDIYRSQVQLLALLAPDVASDVAQSMSENARQVGDVWDRWSHQNSFTGVMNGDPYHSIIASLYAFGARDFELRKTLASMLAGARRTEVDPGTGYAERPGNDEYLKNGYVSGDPSATLEYNAADFGIAQFATRLGDNDTAAEFMKRAQGWQRLYNPADGHLEPRYADGSFPADFDHAKSLWWVEGNGAQYEWMVPFNFAGLVATFGGPEPAAARLDGFFKELNAGYDRPHAMIGNQPSLATPHAYLWTGKPGRTQELVRRIHRELWTPNPDGIVGNDDLGTMSAWYVFTSLGLTPAIAGRAELMVSTPVFDSATVTRTSGQTLTVNAPGAGQPDRFVAGLSVNGKASNKAWLPETFARNGGSVDFTLADRPGAFFGTNPADFPPSFGESQPAYAAAISPGRTSLRPGGRLEAELRVRAVDAGADLQWSALVPEGVSVTPSSGTLTVGAGASAALKLTVATGAGLADGVYSVPVKVSAPGYETTAALQLNVAEPGTVAWHANNAGTSEDGRPALSNYRGGWSYSTQALAAAGAVPGRPFSWDGLSFGWPNRGAGQFDNIEAVGQTIEPAGVPDGARSLVFVGSGAGNDAAGTLTVTYTDGSTAEARLGLSDWALHGDKAQPVHGDRVVIRTPYRNGRSGKQHSNMYLFAAKPIGLDPTKKVKSFTLPKDSAPGSIHVFGWAFGV